MKELEDYVNEKKNRYIEELSELDSSQGPNQNSTAATNMQMVKEK